VKNVKNYDQNDFDERIKNIVFTKGEINSLKIHGKATNKYEIIKVVLSRFGIHMEIQRQRPRINKIRVNTRKYVTSYDINILNILYCKTQGNELMYTKDFMNHIKSFVEYEKNVIKKKGTVKIFR
jgi:hypothetical protein